MGDLSWVDWSLLQSRRLQIVAIFAEVCADELASAAGCQPQFTIAWLL